MNFLARILLCKISRKHFFSIRAFFYGDRRLTGQLWKGGDHLLYHATTSTCSQTLRHLFATLHVRWISLIFSRHACVYQTATRWDLPPYRITIWVIDDVTLVFFCSFTWWFDTRFFFTAIWDGKPWNRTLIDYHPCIKSEPTNKVCLVIVQSIFL